MMIRTKPEYKYLEEESIEEISYFVNEFLEFPDVNDALFDIPELEGEYTFELDVKKKDTLMCNSSDNSNESSFLDYSNVSSSSPSSPFGYNVEEMDSIESTVELFVNSLLNSKDFDKPKQEFQQDLNKSIIRPQPNERANSCQKLTNTNANTKELIASPLLKNTSMVKKTVKSTPTQILDHISKTPMNTSTSTTTSTTTTQPKKQLPSPLPSPLSNKNENLTASISSTTSSNISPVTTPLSSPKPTPGKPKSTIPNKPQLQPHSQLQPQPQLKLQYPNSSSSQSQTQTQTQTQTQQKTQLRKLPQPQPQPQPHTQLNLEPLNLDKTLSNSQVSQKQIKDEKIDYDSEMDSQDDSDSDSPMSSPLNSFSSNNLKRKAENSPPSGDVKKLR